MRKHAIVMGWLTLAGCVLSGGGMFVHAADLDLVGLLTQNLGVTDQQAEDGAGAIFNTAAKNMRVDDLATVIDALPEVKSLMKSASASGSGSGTLGGLTSMLGKSGSSLSSFAGLTDTFSKLGLSSDMVGQFIAIVLEYAQSKGGSEIANLLKAALQ